MLRVVGCALVRLVDMLVRPNMAFHPATISWHKALPVDCIYQSCLKFNVKSIKIVIQCFSWLFKFS